MGRTACAEPQYLYKGALYLLLSVCTLNKRGMFINLTWVRSVINLVEEIKNSELRYKVALALEIFLILISVNCKRCVMTAVC